MLIFTPNPLSHLRLHKQRGAVLMVMLVILIIGATAMLVSSLNSATLLSTRNNNTSGALAQAKEALIGRAVTDANLPGSLPCPDTNDDGIAESFVYVSALGAYECPGYIGRLPWKTLGLPDLRDGSGEELWYALSPSFRDQTLSPPHSLNSDTLGQFNITGNGATSNVVAIVFSAGSVLSSLNQMRDSANQNTITNYLEGNNATNAALIAADITGGTYTNASTYTFISGASTTTFNDQMIVIAHDQLFQPVEMRIAREAKSCLDNYASSSANKYPWAAPVSDMSYTSTYNTYFGRLSAAPSNATSSMPMPTHDPSMSTIWTASCTLFSSTYWLYWNNLVFYQVAKGYQPGVSMPACISCINISGSGNAAAGNGTYRAAVLIARNALNPTQTTGRTIPTTNPPNSYLANNTSEYSFDPAFVLNAHDSTSTSPSTSFITYKPSDPYYQSVNDLVLCLDGINNCK